MRHMLHHRFAMFTFLAFLCVSLFTGSPASGLVLDDEGETVRDRILHFPEERSLGTVFFRYAGAETSNGFGKQAAQGAVVVPTGSFATLVISEEGASDLSPLAVLDPAYIRNLSLSNIDFDASQLRFIGTLSSLEFLDLSQTSVTDDDLQHLSGLTALKYLRLGHSRVTGTGLSHLKGLASLERLELKATPLTDENISRLAHFQSLTELRINGTGITYMGAAVARQLLPNCRVLSSFPGTRPNRYPPPRPDLPARTLDFPEEQSIGLLYGDGNEWNKIGEARGTVSVPAGISIGIILEKGKPENIKYLKNLTGLDVQEVNLYFTEITDEDLNYLNGLTGLESLNLSGCQITDKGFAGLKRHTSLRALDCLRLPITDEALESISGMTRMQSLKLRSTKVSGKGLTHLGHFVSLKVLDLSSTPLEAGALAQIRGFTSLEELYLPGNGLTNESLSALAALSSLRKLSVYIYGSNLQTSLDDGALVHLESLSKLEDLSMFRIPITGSGLIYLRDLPALKTLRLLFSDVQDEHSKQFKFFPALAALDLWSTPLTDKSVQHLKHLTSIHEIMIEDTKISPDAAAYLREELPPYSHVNKHGALVNYGSPPPMTQAQAAKLAATIANNLVERYRGIRPFSPDDYPARFDPADNPTALDKLIGFWDWGDEKRASHGEFTAEIRFSHFGKNRTVRVYDGAVLIGKPGEG
jgi:Leucine-rich repeat (LRR) protein